MEEDRLNAEGYRLEGLIYNEALHRASRTIQAQQKELERVTSMLVELKAHVSSLTHDLLLTQDIAGRYEDALKMLHRKAATSWLEIDELVTAAFEGRHQDDIRASSFQPARAPAGCGGGERSAGGVVEG